MAADQRGTRQQRGYTKTHDRLRSRYQRRMDAGETFVCPRCNEAVDPNEWDLGHTDDRTTHQGPEHSTCNRAAGATRTNIARSANRRRPTEPHPGLIR